MNTDAQPASRRAFRAEFILNFTILAMCVLISILVLLLWRGDRLHAHEDSVITRVRSARSELIAMAQAQSDAEAIASRYLATRQQALLSEFVLAKEDARARVAAVRGIMGADTAIESQLQRLDGLMEQHFVLLDAALTRSPRGRNPPEADAHLVFRTESAALFSLLNQRIDAARHAQNEARISLNLVSGALAVLSLLASVLAILALRREQAHWRMAHAAAEEARAKAAAADLSKTRFLAVASHDMRQPLHALMLYVTALERRVQSAEARDILAKMDRATRSMAGMFSTLLDLARIQSGVIAPEIVDFPLQEVIDRIVAESTEGALDAPCTDISIHSDPTLIERVLRNLVTNAIKHGGGKARLEVTVHGREVEIAVADDGPGIAADDQNRVFEEFVRLDGRSEGLGLGLAIVQRIGELLDMPITLDSAQGRGARFSMRAPLAQQQTSSTQTVALPDALSGVTTLVVDDDPLAREAVGGVLRDLGAEVCACANEAEAEATLNGGFKPDLIVMDFRIDGALCGLDIARRLSAKLPSTPVVIVVTGDTEQETLASLRASGFAWLIKPVDPRILIETAAAQLRTDAVSASD